MTDWLAAVHPQRSQDGAPESRRGKQYEAPAWEARASAALREATRRVRLIGHATPRNLRAELAALEESYCRGEAREARFSYPAAELGDIAQHLDGLSETLRDEGPLGAIYADRATELGVEARLCQTAGSPQFWSLARTRYPARDKFHRQSDALCARWLAQPHTEADGALVRSDDEHDPRSLINLMRQAVGMRRLPIQVVASSRLSARAATGPGFIYVAKDVPMRLQAARRTVLHEVDGHALPRQLANEAPLGIFELGTAHGSDDQEGRAIYLELEGGLLDPTRQRELALRHHAGRMVEQRASFEDTVAALADHDVGLRERLRIAARAHRGGGLAREVVYLSGLLRVQSALQRDPSVDEVLSNGRVAVDHAEALRGWL